MAAHTTRPDDPPEPHFQSNTQLPVVRAAIHLRGTLHELQGAQDSPYIHLQRVRADNGSTITYDRGTAVYTVHPVPSAPTDSFQFSNPDSRVRSFRSNAVLRWEYRPGSTLFFVWSQSRLVNLADPTLDLGHYFGHEMFLDPPTNVLLVKFNYWLSL